MNWIGFLASMWIIVVLIVAFVNVMRAIFDRIAALEARVRELEGVK